MSTPNPVAAHPPAHRRVALLGCACDEVYAEEPAARLPADGWRLGADGRNDRSPLDGSTTPASRP